jgi:hypothetical protein
MPYDLGDTVPLAVTIVDAAGAPTTPATVTLTISGPAGVVPDTIPTPVSTGRYEFDFVPTAPGLYRVWWVSTAPAAAFDDVVDVRPTTGWVVSLADAKLHLNKELGRSVDDEELRGMLPAAVRRVDRHLFTPAQRAAGETLADAVEVLPEQRLAVLTVLTEFWRTQRTRSYGGAGYGSGGAAGASGTAIEADSGPAGAAPLTVRLTDLLGPAAADETDARGAPQGSFPEAQPWPDPACRW